MTKLEKKWCVEAIRQLQLMDDYDVREKILYYGAKYKSIEKFLTEYISDIFTLTDSALSVPAELSNNNYAGLIQEIANAD